MRGSGASTLAKDRLRCGRNGDLWRLFFTHAHAKGLASSSVAWAKGHTTLADVAAGIISLQDHLGNDKADALATSGVETHGNGIRQLGHIFGTRQNILVQTVICNFLTLKQCLMLKPSGSS